MTDGGLQRPRSLWQGGRVLEGHPVSRAPRGSPEVSTEADSQSFASLPPGPSLSRRFHEQSLSNLLHTNHGLTCCPENWGCNDLSSSRKKTLVLLLGSHWTYTPTWREPTSWAIDTPVHFLKPTFGSPSRVLRLPPLGLAHFLTHSYIFHLFSLLM